MRASFSSQRFGGRSLHNSTAGVPTPYELVLEAVGSTLGHFDDDDVDIPCVGFGHAGGGLFNFEDSGKHCRDISHALNRYRRVARDVQPDRQRWSAPSFVPAVDWAILELHNRRGSDDDFEQLHILTIITDSDINRPRDTPVGQWSTEELDFVNALKRASYYPLSVLVVGVGDGRSASEAEIDSEGGEEHTWASLRNIGCGVDHGGGFDNFHFVELGSVAVFDNESLVGFAGRALAHLPEQWRVVQRFTISDEQGQYSALARESLPAVEPFIADPPSENRLVSAQVRQRKAEAAILFSELDHNTNGRVGLQDLSRANLPLPTTPHKRRRGLRK